MGWNDTVDDVLRETWTVDDGNVVRADAYNYLESHGGEVREIEARATVAAAAPDLYRALSDCLEVFENVVDMDAGNPRGKERAAECIRKAEAAMRKARGE